MGFKKTCITLVVGGAIGVGVVAGFNMYNDMQVEANFKETVENIDNSQNHLEIIVESLKSEMNEYLSYPVSYSTATLKNFNEYKEGTKYFKNIITGEVLKNPFNKEEDWVYADPTIWTYAEAESSFNHDANLSTLEYSIANENEILVKVKKDSIFLNEKSIAIDMKTYKELDPEKVDGKTYKNDMNRDAQMLDMEQNMKDKNTSIKSNGLKAWQVKYIEDAPEKINNLYETEEEKKAELKENARASIGKLLDSVLMSSMKKLGFMNEDVKLVVEVEM